MNNFKRLVKQEILNENKKSEIVDMIITQLKDAIKSDDGFSIKYRNVWYDFEFKERKASGKKKKAMWDQPSHGW